MYIFRGKDKDLIKAVKKNDTKKVRLLLSRGASINIKSKHDETLLHIAADKNEDESHFEVCELLLESGADPNARDWLDSTPFYYVVKSGNVKIVELFLKFNADITVLDDEGVLDNEGCNLFFQAIIFNDNVDVVQLLVDRGLDVNHKSRSGKTPLHFLAENNESELYFEQAEILLNNGADVNAEDNIGLTPIYYLVKKANLNMIQLFFNFGVYLYEVYSTESTLLMEAAHFNENVDVIQFLIDQGLNVNHRARDLGHTPLYLACLPRKYNNIHIIKCLLKNGADINAINYAGTTPLTTAITGGHKFPKRTEIVLNFLLEYTDFNLSEDNCKSLRDLNFSVSQETIRMILQQFAKLHSLGIAVQPAYMVATLGYGYSKHDDYLNQCKEELLRAKVTKLPNSWLTFYNLLMDDIKKLKNYAGNRELIKNLKKSDYKVKFPCYGTSMCKNLKRGINRRKLFNESAIVLSDCLPIFNPNHLIIRDTLDCIMSKKDLSILCIKFKSKFVAEYE